MKTKYLGYLGTNDGTHNRSGYEFTNLRDACKTMRAIACGNDTGSGARWYVYDVDEYNNDDPEPIRCGRV